MLEQDQIGFNSPSSAKTSGCLAGALSEAPLTFDPCLLEKLEQVVCRLRRAALENGEVGICRGIDLRAG